MGSEEGKPHFSVFDEVKTISEIPEDLMEEINQAISNLENARATLVLESPSPSSSSSLLKNKDDDLSKYDAQTANEAYKAGRAAMAAGKLDEALVSLNVSLSKCPPDKTSAVAKIQHLISLTSQQLHKPSDSK